MKAPGAVLEDMDEIMFNEWASALRWLDKLRARESGQLTRPAQRLGGRDVDPVDGAQGTRPGDRAGPLGGPCASTPWSPGFTTPSGCSSLRPSRWPTGRACRRLTYLRWALVCLAERIIAET